MHSSPQRAPAGTDGSLPDLDSLVRDTRPLVVRLVARLVGAAHAEDVTQLALSKAAVAYAGFRGDASPRAWLFRIATNAAHDWRRAHSLDALGATELEDLEGALGDSEGASPEARVVQGQMSECVGELVRRLPDGYRTVLALSDCEELSDKEIAAVLGVSVGAAKIRLHRARARLKEELERACSFYHDDRNVLCCDKKERDADGVSFLALRPSMGSNATSRVTPESPTKEQTMTAGEVTAKQKQLIGIGAAVAVGCPPCTLTFANGARSAGACDRSIRFAVESGLAAREGAGQEISGFASATLSHPELDAAFRGARVALDALIGVAAAIAGNTPSRVRPALERARSEGATEQELRVAVEVGRTARRGAERETDAALMGALGDAEGSVCCSGSPASAVEPRCGCSDSTGPEFEMAHIEKTKKTCAVCEGYATKQAVKPIVVMSCDGACLRGEISRQAANHLCHVLAPEKTARLCLGGAFTKDTGQRALVREAERVVALEGCLVRCASRMMRGVLPELEAEVILTDGLCDFDRGLFGSEELPAAEVQRLGREVAERLVAKL